MARDEYHVFDTRDTVRSRDAEELMGYSKALGGLSVLSAGGQVVYYSITEKLDESLLAIGGASAVVGILAYGLSRFVSRSREDL